MTDLLLQLGVLLHDGILMLLALELQRLSLLLQLQELGGGVRRVRRARGEAS